MNNKEPLWPRLMRLGYFFFVRQADAPDSILLIDA